MQYLIKDKITLSSTHTVRGVALDWAIGPSLASISPITLPVPVPGPVNYQQQGAGYRSCCFRYSTLESYLTRCCE
jgi:hypothetical protein